MRRPRSKLQVSTFPFLAVLLCAMGSLLLLLFIMDRRAKIAARYRVAEEVQARQSRTKAEEDARKADWEKAREQLHLSLLAQQDQLNDKSKTVQDTLSEAAKKLAAGQNRTGDLQKQVTEEAARITLIQLEIDAQRNGLRQADKKEASSKAELLDAAKELAELEFAFKQLRMLKEREKDTYSVVPYRGKRGDARPPIYVECVRDGVLFHPEKKLLDTWSMTPNAIRAEVERRDGPLAIQKTVKGKPVDEEAKGPYVLFLIRPDGIASYYKAQSSLKGYQLDFGYELVDAGWVLDFGGGALAKNAPLFRVQQPLRSDDAMKPIASPPLAGNGPSIEGGVGNATLSPPSGFAEGPQFPPGPLLPARPVGPIGMGKPGPSILPPVGVSPGVGSSQPPMAVIGEYPYRGIDTGIPVKPPSFVPIAKNAPPIPIASAGKASTGVPGHDLNPIATPIPGNSVGGQRPKGTPAPGTGTDEPGGPNRNALPPYSADPDKKAISTPPLSRLLGNKDFTITIDCRSDSVTILPGGFTYRWTAANLKATDDALVQTVTNLIARRQASVLPGEPPYRPLIRFQVSADGLQSYHHVHPLLAPLRVPMSRENVQD